MLEKRICDELENTGHVRYAPDQKCSFDFLAQI